MRNKYHTPAHRWEQEIFLPQRGHEFPVMREVPLDTTQYMMWAATAGSRGHRDIVRVPQGEGRPVRYYARTEADMDRLMRALGHVS